MNQGRIDQFFKALPDKNSEIISSTFENNDSDLVPGTPDSNSNKKIFARSFFSSNSLTSIRPLGTSLNMKKLSTKTTPKSSTARSKIKDNNREPGRNSLNNGSSNGFNTIFGEIKDNIDDDDGYKDVFENSSSAKRRDMKPTPEKLSFFCSNVQKSDFAEPQKDIECKDRSFKAIVSKYRTRPSYSFSTLRAFEAQSKDSNLEDLISEIHQKNLPLCDKVISMNNDNEPQGRTSNKKFKRMASERQFDQMDQKMAEDDKALLDDLLKGDVVETDSHVVSLSNNNTIIDLDPKNLSYKSHPINPNMTAMYETEPIASTNDVNEDKHGILTTSLKSADISVLVGNQKDSLPIEEDSPLYHRYGRYKVLSVNRDKGQMLLKLQCAITGANRNAVLTGFWIDTQIQVDDWVNVVGSFDDQQNCIISDEDNLIVVNPDLLVTGTAVSSSTTCMRKMVLSEKFKYTSTRKNHHLIYGTAVHDVFQEVLKNKVSCMTIMKNVVDGVLKGSGLVKKMYEQAASECEVRCEVEKYLTQLEAFMNSYVEINMDTTDRTLTPRHDPPSVRAPLLPIRQVQSHRIHNKISRDWTVMEAIDIEENVWCPRLGLKGKIDVTALVQLHKPTKRPQKKIIPLELKTGKTSYSAEHTGQVMLYSLMLDCLAKEDGGSESADNNDGDDDDDEIEGLLVYLKNCSTRLIPAKRMAVCGLIQLRNRFAFHLRENSKRSSYKNGDGGLPGVIFDERLCNLCDQKLNCCLYQRCYEKNVLQEDHPMRRILPDTLSHLDDSHLDFFYRFCSALHLEDAAENRRSERLECSDIWLRKTRQRVKEGSCINGLVMENAEAFSNCCESLQKFKATFKSTRNAVATSAYDSSFNPIGPGDRVVVGGDGHLGCPAGGGTRRVAFTHGTVQSVDGCGLVEVSTESNLIRYKTNVGGNEKIPLFRIDKVDNFTSLPMNVSNLSRLMSDEPTSEKLRALIIDLRAPSFMKTLPKAWIPTIQPYLKKCNKPQQSAILKALLCEDYILIKGYPGTGKTSTIATLIQILTRLGSSVLLVSYTHSAIDNVLLKLIEKGVDVLRLGKSDKRVHPKILPFLDQTLTSKITSPEELMKFYDSKNVTATTCLSVNHPLFMRRKFDYCIVDEASQSLLVSCLGPLLSSSKFILVGDPDQLPPVVQDGEARALGLDTSLFEHLDGRGATFELSLQYRMNREIMRLSNELIYEGRLVCGSDSVADAKLRTPRLSTALEQVVSFFPEWLKKCLDPQEEVIWLDMSFVNESFESPRTGISNEDEACVVALLVCLFVKAGVAVDDIGVISPFRSQVSLLKKRLDSCRTAYSSFDFPSVDRVEVNTVDQYQGRDKEVVMVSFSGRKRYESMQELRGTEILNDIRRLNVALTRGKLKVILVGDVSYLTTHEPIRRLLKDILRPNQIVRVGCMAEVRGALEKVQRCS